MPRTAPRTRQLVAIVAFDGVRLGSLGMVSDAMALSDRFRGRVYGGHSFYPSSEEVAGLQVRVLTPTGEPVRAAGGPRLIPDGRVGGDSMAKAVVLPAFGADLAPDGDVRYPPGWDAVLPWIARQHAGGALIAAMGASVLALVEAGLLDGRQAVAERRIARRIEIDHPGVSLLPGLSMLATQDMIISATVAGDVQTVRELVRRINSPNSLAWLDAELGRDTPGTGTTDPMIARFMHLARERYAEPHSVASIAAHLGTTERTLRRHCHLVLGTSPSDVIRTLRLDAAQVMLDRSSIPVERVGRLVGYSDAASFRAQFRRRFGHPPSAVRRDRT